MRIIYEFRSFCLHNFDKQLFDSFNQNEGCDYFLTQYFDEGPKVQQKTMNTDDYSVEQIYQEYREWSKEYFSSKMEPESKIETIEMDVDGLKNPVEIRGLFQPNQSYFTAVFIKSYTTEIDI